MKTSQCHLSQLFFSLSLFVLFSSPVQAETTECTVITSLPYTISTQGVYCLKGHVGYSMTSGHAIEINTNNVVLDLNGYKIGGLGAGPGTSANGIHAYQRQNITIRNGTVRGFYRGIFLNDDYPFTTSQGHLIEDIRADMNPYTGIHVEGQGCIIRNNQVVGSGGSTFDTWAFGIRTFGPGVIVLNNDVIGTKEQTTSGYAYGISLNDAPGSVVEDNRIGNTSLGEGSSTAIDIASSLNVFVSNNRVIKMNYGIWYHFGSSSGKFRDNLTSEAPFPGVHGGTDAGNND